MVSFNPDSGIYGAPATSARHSLTLLWALWNRDVKTRYRRSVLGPLWALLQPLVYMVVFTILRGTVTVNSDGIPYPLFSFAALVPWAFFANAVIASAPSVASNASIIKKIAVPREIFPLVSVLTALFDLVMAGVILTGMLVYYHIAVGWSLLWLPVLVMLTAVLAFGMGMLFAACGTFKRDLVMAAPFLMQFWLFVSPIIYPFSQVPVKWQALFRLNPMTGIIEGYRQVLLHARSPDLGLLAWSVAGIAVILTFSFPLFRWTSQYFSDVL